MAPDETKKRDTRISSLPHHMQQTAKEHDVDGDGALDSKEITNALGDLVAKKKENKNLKALVGAFVVMLILLVGAIFGASITAARLSQELSVNTENGFAYVKGTSDVLKTDEAIKYNELKFDQLSNEVLKHMKEIVLAEGDVRFVVKGHARNPFNDSVLFLVEGGTLEYDAVGLVSATGEARVLMEAFYGPDALLADTEGTDGGRRLIWQGWFGGTGGDVTISSSQC